MKYIKYSFLCTILLLVFTQTGNLHATTFSQDMIDNPTRYIEVHDWAFYVAARVAILHNITIENKSTVEYKDIKIRVNYYSTNPRNFGTKVSFQEKVLNITLPPSSIRTYYREGIPIGAGSQHMLAKNLEVLSVRTVLK